MQDPTVLVALISLCGTLVGSVTGVLVSNKLSTYRIEQLEKKLDKYADNADDTKERLVKVEMKADAAHDRIDDIVSQLQIKEHHRG